MKTFLLYFFVALSSLSVFGQTNFVHDSRATSQVVKNSASAIAKESLIRKNLEKAHKAQEAISKYITIVQVNMDRIEKTKQDISAFREGTKNMLVLGRWLKVCFLEVKGLAQDLPNYPFGTLAYSKQISKLTEHVISIGTTISTVVTDGHVVLEGIKYPSKYENLIDPVKRLEVINRCIYELERIFSYVRNIRLNLYARNSLRDAALGITPTAVVSMDLLNEIHKDILRTWLE